MPYPAVEAHGPKKGAHRIVRELSVRKADNGGHIIQHHHSSGHPMEEHLFAPGEGHKALAHIAKHMRIGGNAEEAKESVAEEKTEA